jgi:sec-independent protein translocase protein TatA
MALGFVGGIGPLEFVIFVVVIVLLFGSKRLIGAGRGLGTGLREFKDSIKGDDAKPADELPAKELPAARRAAPAERDDL